MKINIVGGGPTQFLPDLHQYDDDSIWVGVDKGVTILLEKGITPAYAFGDFDSVSHEDWLKIEQTVSGIQRFKPEKDETDMDLAVNWALEQETDMIRIFGGSGGRLDHFFGNVQLLLKPILEAKTTELTMIDKQNIIYAKQQGTHGIERMSNLKYISFIPITPVKNLSLRGFKYPLTNCHIPLGSTLCISNELLSEYGTFSFTEGILLVIRSCD
ncbi:thiamine diphosphokinase [Bacillus sp. DNRA2]|uniref:thiamine diphosphokinase n=1 Tax=Bacillus sp. DNRA2 TaxID=2723053 RepID=UPI00145EB2B4|nr:thiamine diphosphokinase [Bacillus sp. DNRA2]NMD69461.1 thiamine diphosphokinase [Bacillus sp. DNRA2]